MSGSPACSTNMMYIDLAIKGFLAPGQQIDVVNQSLGGALANAMSGGGGKVWDCHLAKGCR